MVRKPRSSHTTSHSFLEADLSSESLWGPRLCRQATEAPRSPHRMRSPEPEFLAERGRLELSMYQESFSFFPLSQILK